MAHQGEPPIAPLPYGVIDNRENRHAWYIRPEARAPAPLCPDYSNDLDDCVFQTLDMNPSDRPDSLQVYKSVACEINVGVAPPQTWEPLLDTALPDHVSQPRYNLERFESMMDAQAAIDNESWNTITGEGPYEFLDAVAGKQQEATEFLRFVMPGESGGDSRSHQLLC